MKLKFTLCDQQYAGLKHLTIVLSYRKDWRNLGRLIIKGKIFEKLVKQLLLAPGSDSKEQYGYNLKKETAIDTCLCMSFFFLFSNHIMSLDAKFSRMHKIKIIGVKFIFLILFPVLRVTLRKNHNYSQFFPTGILKSMIKRIIHSFHQ